MGNIACVPQAPGGFRSSFRRKPSLKKEQNGKKKLPSFFGLDGGQERDTTTDKILQYIPAKIIQKQENQKENLDQRFPSLFKKGRRNTVVRNLGKMIYYSKVKFKFQHCQEIHSCFLELFQSYLYFQSTGPNGLTYQGLLPLKELQVQELGAGQSPGQQEHALHISGPLLNPLVVFCQSEAELKQWLYHLEKQIQLCGGSLALPLLPQSPGDKEELRWSVQNLPVQDWRGSQRESLGEILCLSKVKLQHLPFQEQHERLLVLYPSTLVIVSKERGGLCFKGELPLNAIQVLFEENDKSSFLIEGGCLAWGGEGGQLEFHWGVQGVRKPHWDAQESHWDVQEPHWDVQEPHWGVQESHWDVQEPHWDVQEVRKSHWDVQEPHWDVQESHWDVQKPHWDVQESHWDVRGVRKPHWDVQESHWDAQEPHWDVQEPHWDVQKPHWDVQEPHWDVQEPHWDVQKPHWDEQEPHWDVQKPHWDVQESHWDAQEPHWDAQESHWDVQDGTSTGGSGLCPPSCWAARDIWDALCPGRRAEHSRHLQTLWSAGRVGAGRFLRGESAVRMFSQAD
uniref:Uncharacterized protein n=1 Tax=Geospiza parvula TaxID=87175 RepID=A0A8C3QC86_GEOPR